MLPLFLACENAFLTDEGHIAVEDWQVVDLDIADVPNPLLAGTRICPTFKVQAEDAPEEARAAGNDCYTDDLPRDADGCVPLETPGDVRWQITGVECAGYTPRSDEITLTVVSDDGVTAAVEQGPEGLVEAGLADGTVIADVPDDWKTEPGEPFRIVADEPFAFSARIADASGAVLAWRAERELWQVEGGASVTVSGAIYPLVVTVPLDVEAGISLAVMDPAQHVVEVVGVDGAGIVSLDLVAAFTVGEGGSAPFGARAVARDAEGNLVYGAPITWTMQGGAAIDADSNLVPGGDYVVFEVPCAEAVGGTLTATLVAEYAGIRVEESLSWVVAEGAACPAADTGIIGEGCEKEEECACGGGGAGTVLGLFAALLSAGRARSR